MTRVVSLNICGLPSRLPSPKARATTYCRWFEQSDVDVVNLQEVWTNSLLRFIRDRLPSFTHVAWRPGIAGQPAGGLATFSRVPLSAVSYTSFAGISPSMGTPLFRIFKAINSWRQAMARSTRS